MAEETRKLHPALPHRDVTDPDILRGMAHPLRMQLFDALTEHGPATASELAHRIGDNQANCSWHLRQLHRYGLIEEAPGGTSRRRPWQLVHQTLNLDTSDAGEQTSAAGLAATALSQVLLDRQVAALHQWHLRRNHEAEEWREAEHQTHTWGWLTAEELREFTTELNEVIDRHVVQRLDRIDPNARPAGCRAIRHVSWSIPGDDPQPIATNQSKDIGGHNGSGDSAANREDH